MTVYFKMRQVLLQNATKVYYKIRQVFYYKMRQLLQIVMILLQNAEVIMKCDVYYKLQQCGTVKSRLRLDWYHENSHPENSYP